MTDSVAFLSASELVALYKSRQLSPREVTKAILERIERVNPTINAFTTVTTDLALEQATVAERAYARGDDQPPLAGVPISIKDLTPIASVISSVNCVAVNAAHPLGSFNDLIEFANGSAASPWGRKRAAMGHPAPFNLKMIGVGNEQWGPQYVERYEVFAKALKRKYPNIELVTSAGPSAGLPPACTRSRPLMT